MPEAPTPPLQVVQRWMSLLIQHPVDSDTGAHSDEARALIARGAVVGGEIIRPSQRMTPLQRMDIYNGGYLSRLIEVLESDFDAVKYVLGDDSWLDLASRYVYSHPSQHPNLNRFGRDLPAFLAERRELENHGFLGDLARLQWAVTESFDSAEFESLDMTELQSLTPEQWQGVVLTANPSVRLLHLEYPVGTFLQEFFDGKAPGVPEPLETDVAVYRVDTQVWRVSVPAPIALILRALLDGQPFARALEAGGEHEQDVGHWFREWSADGLFASANRPS